jgi:hypothetical protein
MTKAQAAAGVVCLLIALPCIFIGLWKLQWMLCFFGAMWMFVSFLLLQPQQFFRSARESQIEWEAMWCGLLACMSGGLII